MHYTSSFEFNMSFIPFCPCLFVFVFLYVSFVSILVLFVFLYITLAIFPVVLFFFQAVYFQHSSTPFICFTFCRHLFCSDENVLVILTNIHAWHPKSGLSSPHCCKILWSRKLYENEMKWKSLRAASTFSTQFHVHCKYSIDITVFVISLKLF